MKSLGVINLSMRRTWKKTTSSMVLKFIYKLFHKGVKEEDIPYYWKYSLWTVFSKPIRKWFSAAFIPSLPWNTMRIFLYRMCGYKIGKGVFIGMRCYLDDMCYDLMEIEDNVTISYGVFFACHGKNQSHHKIVIRNGAYIGMRASVIAPSDLEIGERAVVGAMTLVNKSVNAGGRVRVIVVS